MELTYNLKLSQNLTVAGGDKTTKHRYLFVGFKNSLEALSRYDLYVNASKIYSQSWVGPESFIYNAGLSQTIREKCPYVYTCFKNAWNMSNDVCGTYVDLTTAAYTKDKEILVKIPIKINLHQFLLLSSVRYLPSFCGRWEIELYPNWNNLVVLPVHPTANGHVSTAAFDALAAIAGSGDPIANGWGVVSKSFTQIGEKFVMLDLIRGAGSAVTTVEHVLGCNDAVASTVHMNLTTFQLRFEVFEGLRQMYAEQPLIIPTNILHYSRFSGQPGGNTKNEGFHATLSQCLENCDSIIILVPNNTNQTTCFYQPYLTGLRMALGEFGIHPQQYVNTFNDPRFIAMVLDALNLETSDITAMNEDAARALTSPRSITKVTDTNGTVVESWNATEGDASNFFIGVSLSQVGFQAGTVSSPNTNIPFIFDAALAENPVTGLRDANLKIDTSIVCIFLIDAALMIQVVPNSDIPVVKLTNKSIV
jgi:hypothetical protein